MKSDLIAVLDVLFDNPSVAPDLEAVKNIASGSEHPVELMAELVRLLWLADEKPFEFDDAVVELYE